MKQSISIIVLTLLITLSGIQILNAAPDWSVFGDWNSLEFTGNWSRTSLDMYFAGPVIADVTGDGNLEIIIADSTRIRIYSHQAEDEDDVLAVINLPQEDINAERYIRANPAIGDVTGDGLPDIVFACSRFYSGELVDGPYKTVSKGAKSRIYVFNIIDNEAVQKTVSGEQSILVTTPALSDIYPAQQDGKLEMVCFGFEIQQNRFEDPGEGFQYKGSSIQWHLRTYQLDEEGDIMPIKNKAVLHSHPNAADDSEKFYIPNGKMYNIPAVGDMDGDGLPEIFVNWVYGYQCWTYNRLTNQALINNFDKQLENEVIFNQQNNKEGYFSIGPVLADLDNSGTLRGIFPYSFEVEGVGRTMFHAMDINENNAWNWGELGAPLLGSYHELFETAAVGFTDDNQLGKLDVFMHTKFLNLDGTFYGRRFNNTEPILKTKNFKLT